MSAKGGTKGLQRIQVGKKVRYITAMFLMKDRDAILDALANGVDAETVIETINFTAAGSSKQTRKHITALRKEGFELLAVVLPGGACEYCLGNPKHLALAEELVSQVEKEALRRMRIKGRLQ